METYYVISRHDTVPDVQDVLTIARKKYLTGLILGEGEQSRRKQYTDATDVERTTDG